MKQAVLVKAWRLLDSVTARAITVVFINTNMAILKDGQFVIEPQFQLAGPFREGLATVESGGKWGAINRNGEFVIKPQFDFMCYFKDGLAEVKKDGKWGYVDRNGNIALPIQYDKLSLNYNNGLFVVKDFDGKWKYINKKVVCVYIAP